MKGYPSRLTRGQLIFISVAAILSAVLAGLGTWMASYQAPGPSTMVVYKRPTCVCCSKWVEHVRNAGFDVKVRDEPSSSSRATLFGISPELASCHTARIDGYFIEGHVPPEDIKKLLQKRPKAKGLAVPGMPMGSPGMEAGARKDPFDVLLVLSDDTTEVFTSYPAQGP